MDDSNSKRGILKTTKPEEYKRRRSSDNQKAARFDEKNVQQTYHPPNKTYGLMKIDEPKTPNPAAQGSQPVSSGDLRKRLEMLRNSEQSSSDDTLQSRKQQRREEFEKRRRMSYHNEFKLAKEMKKDLQDDVT